MGFGIMGTTMAVITTVVTMGDTMVDTMAEVRMAVPVMAAMADITRLASEQLGRPSPAAPKPS